MKETPWMEAIVRHCSRAGRGFVLWRQQAGELVVTQRGRKRRLVFAPVGSADIVGIGPGGVHVEIEAKVRAPHTEDQRAWGDMVRDRGGVYVVARYSPRLSLAENLLAVDVALSEAAAARTGGGRPRGGEASATPPGAPYGRGASA